MKAILNLAVVTCFVLAASSSAFAKKAKLTLPDFKGNYSGTGSLSVTGGTFSGPVSLVFGASKNGKTGSITLSGSMSFGGTTLPVNAVVTLTKGSFAIDNFVFSTLVQGSYPGSGSYRLSKRGLTLQGSAVTGGQTYPFSGGVTTKTKGRKQSLVYTTTIVIGGQPYVYTFSVSRHLKKSEL